MAGIVIVRFAGNGWDNRNARLLAGCETGTLFFVLNHGAEAMIRDSVIDWQELSALYEKADELDAAALSAWLTQLRSRKHRLVTQLERMLDARERVVTGGFLDVLPKLEGAAAPGFESEWAEGSGIGAYRLIRHVGSGGMAEVWLAERADGAFERQVAIKLLFNHPSRSQRETFVERFKRERDILASLHHPNIGGLHDAGVTAGGQPWLALEYVEGIPITAWCDTRRLTIEERVKVFRQVLLAVEHAHANLIIHRDLKPSNILVTGQGEVKLLDFGIAKLLSVGNDHLLDTALTHQGGRPLTLQYASPEQLDGRPLTTVSDVYSLGVVLYELLCGARPYDGERLRSAARLESAILAGDLMPPSRQAANTGRCTPHGISAKALSQTLSGDLDAVSGKALSGEIARRYASVEALRNDLDRWCEGRPVLARPASAGYRARKFYLRHKLGVWSGAISVSAVLGLTIATVVAGLKAQSESVRAIASRDFVVELFRLADPENLRGRQMSAGELLDAGRKRALETLAGQPGLQADVLHQIGVMQGYAGDFRRADENLAQSADLFAREGREREWAIAQFELADNAFYLGDMARASAAIEAVGARLARFTGDDDVLSRYWGGKGVVSSSSRHFPQAIEELTRAMGFATRARAPDHGDTIDVLRSLALAYSQSGRYAEALAQLEDAARRVGGNSAAGERDVFAVHSDLAITTIQAGRYKGGIERLRSLISRCDTSLGSHDDHCVVLANYLAWLAMRLDDRATRTELLPRLLAAAANDASPRRQANSANMAGEILAADGGLAARPELRVQLLKIAQTDTLPTRERTRALLCLAQDALRQARPGEAELWANQALDFQALVADADPDLIASGKLLRGLARHAQSRDGEALVDVRSAVRDLGAALGAGHTLVALYRCNEVTILRDLGRREEAVRELEGILAVLTPVIGDAPIGKRLRDLLVASRGQRNNDSKVAAGEELFF
ncbi:MAG: protein kinase [Caldimonas sp.]